ncbi:sugar ABC transporter permease [Thermatribacter velox]|uniref:Sugar ABC transporter permease n=1 Tax=Thermatribacter velox TaxID=3039681 RepID=A0ABZ2YCJ2_9BACT
MKTKYFPLVVLVPVTAWFMVFFFYPAINSFRISMYEWNVIDPAGSPFVCLANYKELFRDKTFLVSIKNTFIFVAIRIFLGIPIGLFVAVLLERINKLRNLFLGLIFAPYVASITSMSILFRWLLQPKFGMVNQVLELLGLPTQRFLSHPGQTIVAASLVDIWQSLGYSAVLFLAGLLEIPKDFEEAARIDGANEWRVFFRIKLPLLANVTLFVFVTTLIGAFQVFERVAMLAAPSMNDVRPSNYVMSFFIYRYAIHHMRLGYACAAAVIMFAVIFVFTLIQLKVLRRRWEY